MIYEYNLHKLKASVANVEGYFDIIGIMHFYLHCTTITSWGKNKLVNFQKRKEGLMKFSLTHETL